MGDHTKENCWEFKRCGREPGGNNSADFGVCPAATETGLDKIHSGINAGRACWVVAGTSAGEKCRAPSHRNAEIVPHVISTPQ